MLEDALLQLRNKELQSRGMPLIGWTCTYLPVEILEAAGLQPYRILPEPSSEKADAYLDPNFCPLVKASLGSALEGAYSLLSGVVLVNTCDGMRRLYDAWRYYCSPDFSLLLDVPRIVNERSVSLFAEELRGLVEALEEHFHLRITRDSLTESIRESNATRNLLMHLLSLHQSDNLSFGYGDIMDILSAGWKAPRSGYNKTLENLVEELEHVPRTSAPQGPRVMLVGSFLEASSLIRLVEKLGAYVTAVDICSVDRFPGEIALSSDPLMSLSRAYLEKTPCARMHDTEKRMHHILERAEKTGAQGVIYHSLKFCDPYLYEAPAVQDSLTEKNIPVLFLEGNYTGRAGGRTHTRIQAFLEMLERHGRY